MAYQVQLAVARSQLAVQAQPWAGVVLGRGLPQATDAVHIHAGVGVLQALQIDVGLRAQGLHRQALGRKQLGNTAHPGGRAGALRQRVHGQVPVSGFTRGWCSEVTVLVWLR